MIIEGFVHVIGDDVDTDVIIPGSYLALTDPKEVAKHVFERVEPEFRSRVRPGDVLVAGKNFGSGSSREQAVWGLIGLGISAVIAKSYARIFYRNAINAGLPIFISRDVVDYVNSLINSGGVSYVGDFIKSTNLRIRINADNGVVTIGDRQFAVPPMPSFIQEIIRSGGVIEWARKQLRGGSP